MSVIFDDTACTCPHPALSHDDGFGCTEHDCDCLAGWLLEDD